MRNSFGQKDAARYLAKCGSQDQVQDVLTAYVYAKFANGANTQRVLHKLELLVIFLRVNGLGWVITNWPRAFLVINYHISVLNGGSIGAIPTSNQLAHDAWNHARRVRRPNPPSHSTPSTTREPQLDSPLLEAEKWGARGPGCLIALPEVDGGRIGQPREERLRVTALTPEEIRWLGPYAVPTFRSLTLPSYEGEDAEPERHTPSG